MVNIRHLSLKQGESLFLHGPSGSGKSTLLGLLSGILKADSGDVILLGRNFSGMSSHERDLFRGIHIGYIFQMFNLIPYMSVRDNILLPCRMNPRRCKGNSDSDVRAEAEALMSELGISAVSGSKASRISTGQAQRAAAARALLGRPEIIIADEPTSALDADHRSAFMETLQKACAHSGSSLIFVSHDHSLAAGFTRSMNIRDQKERAL